VILISVIVFILSHLLNMFLSKMAQNDETHEYHRLHRGGRKRYQSDSSDQFEYERQKLKALRKREKRRQRESSDSDTPKGRFMMKQYPRFMDRASRILMDKNSSNRLISRSALRSGKRRVE
jgi:predicted phosphohydrolase